jgi:UDP-N-acetyl-D-mannosaminuronic acid dehydrogenase
MGNIHKICCSEKDSLKHVMKIIEDASSNDLPSGIAVIVDNEEKVVGTITDGDIRRALLSGESIDVEVSKMMNTQPIYFEEALSVREILEKLPDALLSRKRKSNRYLSKILIVDKHKTPVRILEYHELWEQKVATHRHIVVVGLGYVGLTMAVVMADAGFMVTGVEVDANKCEMLNRGESYIHEVGLQELLREQINKNFNVSTVLPADGDVYIISVGTPVINNESGKKVPILTYLKEACENIGSKLNRGNLVILRSTVPIGTCRNYVKNILEETSQMRCGIDFHLSFAPERTAEGKALKELRSLPQIIGGYNSDSLEVTAAIFRDLTPTIVKVDSLEAAEMAKLINNSFRDYIFAYSNQMAKIASAFNIDVFGVIKAANEGYVRDPVPLPSPGVGGPCLTKDPHIFASVAENVSFNPEIFINGRAINESMHEHVFQQVSKGLESIGKKLGESKLLIAGLAFKGYPETGDIRNSSAVDIAELFKNAGADLYVHDPIALISEIEEYGYKSVNLTDGFKDMDVVLFLNNHKSFEKIDVFSMVRSMNQHPIIYDGWNAFRSDEIISVRPSTYMNLSLNKTSII